jgi:hypothetical protein
VQIKLAAIVLGEQALTRADMRRMIVLRGCILLAVVPQDGRSVVVLLHLLDPDLLPQLQLRAALLHDSLLRNLGVDGAEVTGSRSCNRTGGNSVAQALGVEHQ